MQGFHREFWVVQKGGAPSVQGGKMSQGGGTSISVEGGGMFQPYVPSVYSATPEGERGEVDELCICWPQAGLVITHSDTVTTDVVMQPQGTPQRFSVVSADKWGRDGQWQLKLKQI